MSPVLRVPVVKYGTPSPLVDQDIGCSAHVRIAIFHAHDLGEYVDVGESGELRARAFGLQYRERLQYRQPPDLSASRMKGTSPCHARLPDGL